MIFSILNRQFGSGGGFGSLAILITLGMGWAYVFKTSKYMLKNCKSISKCRDCTLGPSTYIIYPTWPHQKVSTSKKCTKYI